LQCFLGYFLGKAEVDAVDDLADPQQVAGAAAEFQQSKSEQAGWKLL
jgi:hypothetical protein